MGRGPVKAGPVMYELPYKQDTPGTRSTPLPQDQKMCEAGPVRTRLRDALGMP